MAAAYIGEMRTVQPHGPYRIGGHCSGAWVAFEMARQLEAGRRGDRRPSCSSTRARHGVQRAALRLGHVLGRLRFYLREGRLIHTILWESRVALERLRLRRMWDPSSEHIAMVRGDPSGGPPGL